MHVNRCKGVYFGALPSFLVCTLVVHGDIKLDSRLTVMQMFQQFVVHGRFTPRWFLGYS